VNCVLMDMTDSFGRYAVRYWLTDLALDDPTDSEVRTCVYFALQRAEMRLAQPSHSVLLTEASSDSAASKTQQQLERRKKLLERIDLFAALSDGERAQLAAELKYSPFTRGEVMTKEGAEAHWLYLVEDGQASVRVGDGALEREVASLTAPTVFGEMSLLTGERRAATVVATSDVECFRLDKVAVQRILASRPALAEQLAALLAKRRAALVAAKEDLSADALRAREATDARDLLSRIKRFLAIDARES
jgi:CRP-like cAMP-binding protein